MQCMGRRMTYDKFAGTQHLFAGMCTGRKVYHTHVLIVTAVGLPMLSAQNTVTLKCTAVGLPMLSAQL